jgi:hypothetical protein
MVLGSSFSLINVKSTFHCLRSFFLLLMEQMNAFGDKVMKL